MYALIKPSFWADRHIEAMPPEQKLALVWLLTNGGRDRCGFTIVTPRRFTFDTGLPMAALDAACEATCGSIQVLPQETYFVRAFVRHQFSQGDGFSLKNNTLRSIAKYAGTLPPAVRAVFFKEYPELVLPQDGAAEDGDAAPPSAPPENPASTMTAVVSPATADGLDAVSLAGLYPRRQSVREAVRHIARHLADGADPRSIADGTRAIAAVIRDLPGGHLNAYVPSAEKFFANRRWEDDPRTWLRASPAKGSRSSNDGGPVPELSLGGRTGTTIRIGG